MKQLTCEMCLSNDLVKQDGFFVCQNCGTKYSVEEAKKMMIEGTVDVAGTVKIDTSDELQNLYQLARRAKEDGNAENACKYYDMIAVKDPTSWEAAFYNVYYKAMQTKIMNIQSAAVKVDNCLKGVFELINEYVKDTAEQSEAICQVIFDVGVIADMLFSAAVNHYEGIDLQIRSRYTDELGGRLVACIDLLYHCGNYIESVFEKPELKKHACKAWKLGIAKKHYTVNNNSLTYLKKISNMAVLYSEHYTKSELETAQECTELLLTQVTKTKKIKKNPIVLYLKKLFVTTLVTAIVAAIIWFFIWITEPKTKWEWVSGYFYWIGGALILLFSVVTYSSAMPKASIEDLDSLISESETSLDTIKQAISKK